MRTAPELTGAAFPTAHNPTEQQLCRCLQQDILSTAPKFLPAGSGCRDMSNYCCHRIADLRFLHRPCQQSESQQNICGQANAVRLRQSSSQRNRKEQPCRGQRLEHVWSWFSKQRYRPTQTRNRVHIVSILIFGNNCLHRIIHCKRAATPETPSTVKNRRQYFRCMPHQPSPQRSSPMVKKTSTIPDWQKFFFAISAIPATMQHCRNRQKPSENPGKALPVSMGIGDDKTVRHNMPYCVAADTA